jgi:drug/metabolite transporter (DMT)-like permease
MTAFRDLMYRCIKNGSLFAILAALGFSFKAIFVKLSYAAGPVDAITLLALRMALSLPLFLWILWISRREVSTPLSLNHVLRIMLLGMFGYYLASLFDFHGLNYISAGLERLILFTYPTIVLLIQAYLLRERPTRRTLAAMAICYFGLGIAFFHDLSSSDVGGQVITGALWVFGSAVTYAMYYAGTGAMLKHVSSLRLAGLAGTSSSVMVLIHYVIVADLSQLPQLPPAVFINSALMALFSTVLPIYWLALAIERMGATQTAALGNLGPVLTMVASWAILDEAISTYQVAGMALVLFGVSRLRPAKPKLTPRVKDA